MSLSLMACVYRKFTSQSLHAHKIGPAPKKSLVKLWRTSLIIFY